MHFTISVILAALSVGQVSAFTNGTLVPSYICNPNADGLPKAFAQVLPYTRKALKVVGFDAKAGDNDNNIPQVATTKTSLIGNSAYVLASFHNSPNKLTSIQQGISVTTANGGPLVAGQANQLVLKAAGNNVALGGALLYATAGGARVGSFVDQGTTNTFVPFPGCGTNAQGQVSGVIQQQGVSATGTYKTLFYNAPAGATGQITIQGLSVTANGFGVWNYTFSVQNNGQNANASAAALAPVSSFTAGQGAAAAAAAAAKKGASSIVAPAVAAPSASVPAAAGNAGAGNAAASAAVAKVSSLIAAAGIQVSATIVQAAKATGAAPCGKASAAAAPPAVAAAAPSLPAKVVKVAEWNARENKMRKRWAA